MVQLEKCEDFPVTTNENGSFDLSRNHQSFEQVVFADISHPILTI